MNTKKILWLGLVLFLFSLSVPKTTQAVDWVGLQERFEYFFAFKIEKKIEVLDKQADRKLETVQGFVEKGDKENVQNQLQNYLETKEKQDGLLGKTNNKNVLDEVLEKTIEQQKTMEDIKTGVDEGTRKEMIVVQEKVVNQVAKRVIDVDGKVGQTEFFGKVEHVWAPGTSGTGSGGVEVKGGLIQFAPGTSAGGQSGTMYKGGAGQQFAPGTSSGGGGNAGADIKTVEVKGL